MCPSARAATPVLGREADARRPRPRGWPRRSRIARGHGPIRHANAVRRCGALLGTLRNSSASTSGGRSRSGGTSISAVMPQLGQRGREVGERRAEARTSDVGRVDPHESRSQHAGRSAASPLRLHGAARRSGPSGARCRRWRRATSTAPRAPGWVRRADLRRSGVAPDPRIRSPGARGALAPAGRRATCLANRRASGIWTSASATSATARTGRNARQSCSALAETRVSWDRGLEEQDVSARRGHRRETSRSGPRSGTRASGPCSSLSLVVALPVRSASRSAARSATVGSDRVGLVGIQDPAVGVPDRHPRDRASEDAAAHQLVDREETGASRPAGSRR